jgi:hypothetical protein
LAERALRECDQPSPDVLIDARCFIDFERLDATRAHIGTRPIIMNRITFHADFYDKLRAVQVAYTQWSAAEKAQPFTVAVFCRQGEKRSVAFAALVAACLRANGCKELSNSPSHLSSWFWRFKTCAGKACTVCTADSADRQAAHERAQELWQLIAAE